jgi:hypothetical protein
MGHQPPGPLAVFFCYPDTPPRGQRIATSWQASKYKPLLTQLLGRDEALKKSSTYFIMKKVKAGESTDNLHHQNPKKTKRTVDIVAAVTADIKEERRMTHDMQGVSQLPWGLIWNYEQKSSR